MIHKILNDHKNHQTIRLERDKRICKHTQGARNCPKGKDTHASKKLQWTCLQRSWSYAGDIFVVIHHHKIPALCLIVELDHSTFCRDCALSNSSLWFQNRLWEKERETTYKTHETVSLRHIRLLMLIRNALRHHKTRNDFPMVHALETQQFFGAHPPSLLMRSVISAPSTLAWQPPTWAFLRLIHFPAGSRERQGAGFMATQLCARGHCEPAAHIERIWNRMRLLRKQFLYIDKRLWRAWDAEKRKHMS